MPGKPVTWASFFETFPLYKKWKIPAEVSSSENPPPATWSLMWKPSLTMLCDAERHKHSGDAHKTRTFKMANTWGDTAATTEASGEVFGHVARAVFACADCGRLVTFLVEFGPEQMTTILPDTAPYRGVPGEEIAVSKAHPPVRPVTSAIPPAPPPGPAKMRTPAWVRKVGQCPPWWPEIDKELERALASNVDSYKKALSCEGESYGMGAFAYYRAIVERIIESLKERKVAGLDETAKKGFEEAWQRAERDGSARVALVYDVLPEEVRVDGANPLGDLYTSLSAGLHGGNDIKCMDEVEELRGTLLDLVMSIQRESDRKATADRTRARLERTKKGAT